MRPFLLKFCSLFFIVTFLTAELSGCGKTYDGIAISNSSEISEGIRTIMLHRGYSAKISFSSHLLNDDEVTSIVDGLMDEAFYESDASHGGDYLRYQYGGYSMTHSASKSFLKYVYTIKIVPNYYTSAKDEEAVDELVKEAIESSKLNKDSSDYDKIKWVHDYICDTVDYDTVHKHTPGSGHVQSTAFGALTYHTALCQGYAVLCYRLLKELGVDTRIVTGQAVVADKSERHAWNIVAIDGQYYNLDVTIDDVNSSFEYFLKTDEDFSVDHSRDDKYLSQEFYDNYPMAKENY